MNRQARPTPRRELLSALAALLLLNPLAHANAAQAGATRRFASGDLSFEHPAAWAVAPAPVVEALVGFTLQRPGLGPQITLYVSEREIDSQFVDVLRKSLFEPYIEQVAQQFEALGARVQRTSARTAIGGVTADGTRLLLSAGAESGSAEFYMLLLGRRMLMISYTQTQNNREAAAAWELFRNTVAVGPGGQSGGQVAAAPAAPSDATLDQGLPLISESLELTQRVVKLRAEGKYAEALPLAERAVALAERVDALDLPVEGRIKMTPGALNVLAELHRAAGQYDRAEPLFRRSLALTEKEKGAEDPSLAAPLNNLATLYLETGDYAKAEPLFQRAVQIAERAKGPNDPFTATALNNLAQFYDTTNDFARAEELMTRALAVREKALGPEHPDVAVSLSNLGALYDQLGDPRRAEELMRRALRIIERGRGPDHPETATVLNNLGFIFRHAGDFQQAEHFFVRALAVNEKALGPDHPTLASTVDNLAQLFFARGEFARAEAFFKRALSIRERAFGADHADVAESLSNLALFYQEQNDLARAESLLLRARGILERKFGPEHMLVATVLDNLSGVYRSLRQIERAEPLASRALSIREKLFGPESAEAAVSYNNLGSLALHRGDAARAEELYQRGLRAYERVYGAEHPNVALFLNNLSTTHLARGDVARAVATQARAEEVRERQLALVLSTGSEEQKRQFLFAPWFRDEVYYTFSLHANAAPADQAALRLALTTLMRRKGRVLDAMSDQIGALRRRLRPEDRALLEKLSARRAELSTLVLKGPGKATPAEYQARLAALGAEVGRLEGEVSARSSEYRAQAQPVSVEAVQRALPAGTTLVEFAVYRPYNPKSRSRAETFGAPRYAAYVLPHSGPAAWVELGETAAIDRAVAGWRAALADPRRADVRALARDVDERVMRPVRKLLGAEARQLFLSPDGALNLIPFGALADEQDRYLIETYSITYLTSGRDLLRLQLKAGGQQPPVVVADPAFDAGGAAPALRAAAGGAAERGAPGEGRRSLDLSGAHFTRLPGTAGEARAIGAILPGVRVLTAAQATEATLKQLSRPAVLHVATHGFFLADQRKGGPAAGGGVGAPARGENPLLRSGLALAGANALAGGAGEDGILTAYEAAGLDLWGTKLVVLSACETGVGEVQNGDGVYGLRRALVLAGSESQVMSLWQVSDEATRDLMVGYYKRLQAGAGRSDALRRVQLDMLTGREAEGGAQQRGLSGQPGAAAPAGDRSHPFYWAAFIQSGDWRPMR